MERNNEFLAHLHRLQMLQVLAYENGLNMQINTRDTNSDGSWITGSVYYEAPESFLQEDRHLHFYLFSFRSNKEKEAELNRVEKWILDHKNI